MITFDEYRQYDAVGLAELIRSGQTTALEVLECAIELTETLNPQLNAVVIKDYEAAREQARQFVPSAPISASGLAGVPFLIKDIAAVRDLPQSRASRLFADDVAKTDSRIAARFRQAGLINFGKTNTPELCVTITTESALFGPCHNPSAPGHSTGGSSGGAAAAVAAGIVPAAHGSDGGGSIRIPASCCGLIGLKPSRGLTVVERDSGGSWSGLSVNHVLTRSVRDSAAFLDILREDRNPPQMAPPFPAPAHQSYLASHNETPGPLRVAVHREHPAGFAVHPDCLAAVQQTERQCRALGHQVTELAPPVDYTAVTHAMIRIINVHVAQIVIPALEARGLGCDTTLLEEATRRMAFSGSKVSACEYLAAMDVLKQAEGQMAAFHQEYDVILSPVLAQPPATSGWLDMDSDDMKTYGQRFAAYSGFAALYNGTGQPSIALPLHRNGASQPVGVMFSGAWGEDLQLLQLSAQLMPHWKGIPSRYA